MSRHCFFTLLYIQTHLEGDLNLAALAIPGSMEHFFDELESALQDGTMDDAKHRAISQKYGIEWLE